MKKYLYILGLLLVTCFSSFAQDDDGQDEKLGRLQVKMREYIQKRLELSKSESEKFAPIFLRYVVDLRRTHRDFKADRPMLQLKIAELRIKYRTEFRQVVDEKRANKIYEYQREFEIKVRETLEKRQTDNRRPTRTEKLQLE